MAIQLINVGTSPNDGTGDTPRAAGQKLNGNFSDSSNAASKLVDTDATGGTVPVRDSGGTFKIGAPTGPAHPVRKQEFDNDPRVKWVSGDKIITVADSGADFTTVMGAVAEAMKWRSIDGSVIVEIQSGYLVQEQLFFIDNDYSHINIRAQNGATITVDHNSMSVTDFEGSGLSGFILCARGKSPMFQAQFEFLTRPADTISGAIAVFSGEIYFGNNSGVKGAGSSGVFGTRGGSVAMGDGNNFSGAGSNGAYATRGGSVTMGDSNDFSGAGGSGAYGNHGGSVVMGNNNNFSGAGSSGVYIIQGGSVTMGSSNDFSGAGDFGALGTRGGSVTMGDSNDFSGAGDFGAIGTRGGSVVMGNNNNFSGAGSSGVYIIQGGSVTMGDSNDFSGAGNNGAYATRGGSVTMGDSNDFSGVPSGYYSFNVANNGIIQAGTDTIFTTGRERSQAAGVITTSGLIMG